MKQLLYVYVKVASVRHNKSLLLFTHTQLVSNLPPSLTHLNMSGFRNTMLDGHVAEIVSRCPMLVDLNLSDSNHLTANTVFMLVQRLGGVIKGVNLSRCYSVSPDCLL